MDIKCHKNVGFFKVTEGKLRYVQTWPYICTYATPFVHKYAQYMYVCMYKNDREGVCRVVSIPEILV